MEKSHAYRNLDLCTKDCLCLFVCPVGATNTETGQIDFEKCTGCGACARACPSKAITMIPNIMPPQAKKNPAVVNELSKIADNKIEEIKVLKNLLLNENDKNKIRLYKALIHSNKVVIEDIMRESGYMLPQSKNAHIFLKNLLNEENNVNKEIIQKLLDKLEIND